jgi:hypothetical protein
LAISYADANDVFALSVRQTARASVPGPRSAPYCKLVPDGLLSGLEAQGDITVLIVANNQAYCLIAAGLAFHRCSSLF